MNKWTREFPQSPGSYWFYGDPFGSGRAPHEMHIRLHYVRVVQASNGLAVISDMNSFMYPSEVFGLWMPVELPEFPNTENTEGVK